MIILPKLYTKIQKKSHKAGFNILNRRNGAETKAVGIFSVDNNGMISSSHIDKKSVTEAFFDFFENLPGSDLVYDRDITLKIIDDFIINLIHIRKSE